MPAEALWWQDTSLLLLTLIGAIFVVSLLAACLLVVFAWHNGAAEAVAVTCIIICENAALALIGFLVHRLRGGAV